MPAHPEPPRRENPGGQATSHHMAGGKRRSPIPRSRAGTGSSHARDPPPLQGTPVSANHHHQICCETQHSRETRWSRWQGPQNGAQVRRGALGPAAV